jgi:AraC family transcriptional regulator
MTDPATNPYAARIDRVTRHIQTHLADDLSLDSLADIAAFSRFHFHRVFAAMTGETVAEAVRRARLNRAAVLVVTSPVPFARIAAEVGYPNTQSFARAFRTAFGTTPAARRRLRRLPPPLIPLNPGDLPMHPVTFETLPARRLVALPHHGAYTAIGATCVAFWDKAPAAGLGPRLQGPLVCIYYDDPSAVPVGDLRSHVAVAVGDAAPLPAGFDDIALPGGRCAVLTMTGPYSGIPAAWSWLYRQWLPASGHEPADSAPWEEYPNSPMDAPPEALITRICVPLRDG